MTHPKSTKNYNIRPRVGKRARSICFFPDDRKLRQEMRQRRRHVFFVATVAEGALTGGLYLAWISALKRSWSRFYETVAAEIYG
jgi:hypothetical protein